MHSINDVQSNSNDIIVRTPRIDFETPLTLLWFRGNSFLTYLSNGLSLTFPLGERCFVYTLRRHMSSIEDPVLRECVKCFGRQEAQHALAHEDALDALRRQGFDLGPFFTRFTPYIDWVRALRPDLQLAITAAFEHYTATVAELFIETHLLEGVHAPMRQLLLWHATEELEHRHVALEVMRAQALGYVWRIAGFALASAGVVRWAIVGTQLFRVQSKTSLSTLLRDYRAACTLLPRVGFWRRIVAYLRPDFDPNARTSYFVERARQLIETEGVASARVPRASTAPLTIHA